ncbi:MAG: FG-GAP repeat protein [Candidatus Edwardsbacteria bacterium]|nr:FG-GAP repeat protein [Candidatus Edwardsbacteria bacterium]MBU2594999.1 FG-GAP repeat protein [Candidatus Edwardsbacteria bacterium]
MKKIILTSCLLSLVCGLSQTQTTYNLDIIWQKVKPEASINWGYWGFNMASGDLNNDGYSDFLSSIDSVINVSGDRIKCKVYIYNGASVLSTTPSQVIVYDSMGYHPSFCIADFNKDGYGDLAIGDSRGIGVNSEKGQINIHYGTGIDLNPTPDLIIGGYGSATATSFGAALSVGDINGDGIDDLVVGAPNYPISGDRNGRVFVYYGDTLGLHTWPDIMLNGHSSPIYYENFGIKKSRMYDLNQDGYDDIIAAGPVNSIGGTAAGKVYIYLSNNAPLDTMTDGWLYGEMAEQYLGAYNLSMVQAETIGYKPIPWFGTPNWPSATGSFGEGKCYMVPGDTIGELTSFWTITGEDTGLGFWSSAAGYADGDKLDDMLAGASPSFDQAGRAYLYLRRPTMKNQYDAYIQGRYSGSPGDVMGARVAPAGDVDGCGRDEFLVSNYYANNDTRIWLCRYTGPDGVAAEPPANSGQRTAFKLGQNYPNPFNGSTVISFQLPGSGPVNLSIYNIAGQLVRTLINDNSVPLRIGEGREGSVTWDGRDEKGQKAPNGIYIYKLNRGGESMVKKMTLLR